MKTIAHLRRTIRRLPSPRKVLSAALAVSLMIPGPMPWVGAGSARAQTVPQRISYQGRLTDTLGNPESGNHDFIFSIHDAVAAGGLLWTETQNAVPVVNGVFSVSLGAVSPIPNGVFDRDTAYLQVNVDGADMSPRDRLLAVPYAFNAALFTGKPAGSFVSTTTAAQTIAGDKTFTGTVAVPDPSLDGQAANKGYVDGLISGGAFWTRNAPVLKPAAAGDNVVIQSTLTVQGEAFSVGISTLTVRDGRVGVGTSSPGERLDVIGRLRLASGANVRLLEASDFGYLLNDGNLAMNGEYVRGNHANGLVLSTPLTKIVLSPADTMSATFLPNGNVGIGTTSPQERLHVSSGSAVVDFGIRTGTLTFAAGLTGDPAFASSGMLYYNASSNKLRLYNGAWADLATGASGTFVSKTGDDMTGQLTLRGASVGVSSITALGAVGIGGVGLSNGTLVVKSTSTDATNPVVNVQANDGTELMRVQQDGNLGIGSTNFAVGGLTARLRVGGGPVILDNGQYLAWANAAGTNNVPAVAIDSSDKLLLRDGGPAGIGFISDGTERMLLTNTQFAFKSLTSGVAFQGSDTTTDVLISPEGRVGIGTTSPAQKVHMSSGTLLIDGDATTAFQVGVSSFIINSEGRVGVGTVPSTPLHVRGEGNLVTLYRTDTGHNLVIEPNSLTSTTGGINLNAQGGASITIDRAGGAGDVPLLFQHRDFGGVPSRISTSGNDFLIGIEDTTFTRRLKLRTFAQDRLTIDPGGKVGIGTTSPQEKLHVSSGSAVVDFGVRLSTLTFAAGLLAAPAAAGKGMLYYDAGTDKLRLYDGAWKDLATGGSSGWTDDGLIVKLADQNDNVVVQSTLTVQGNAFSVGGSTLVVTNGNIGLGTTNPLDELHLANPAGSSQARLLMQDTFPGSTAGNKVGRLIYDGGENVGGGGWVFQKMTDAGAFSGNLVTIVQNTGNVGIGMVDPGNRLSVSGAASFGGNAASGGEPIEAQGATAGLSLYDRAGGAGERWVIYSDRTGGAGTNTLRFWTGSDKVGITSAGSMGIGTTSPNVGGFASPTLTIKTADTANLPAVELFGDRNAANAAVGAVVFLNNQAAQADKRVAQIKAVAAADLDAGRLALMTADNAGALREHVRLDESGFVGIGTASPAQKVHLSSGTLLIDGDTSTAFKVGVSSFIINSEGRVGIGTTGPGAKLDISGDALWGSVAGRGRLYADASTVGVGSFSNHDLVFFTNNGGAQVTLKTSGNVGVGTTSPNAGGFGATRRVLTLSGAGGGIPELENTAADGADNILGIVSFRGANSGGEATRIQSNTLGATAGNRGGYLAFHTKADAGSLAEQVRIDNGGKVGIGTTSPGGKLHIRSGTVTSAGVDPSESLTITHTVATVPSAIDSIFGGIVIQRDKATALAAGDALGGINFGGGPNAGDNRNGYAAIGALSGSSTGKGQLVFYTAATDRTPSERVRINENGNVGIGTTGPKDQLQIGNRTTFHDAGASWSLLQNNLYFDGADYRNIAAGGGSNILLGATINFRTAASGAADAVATVSEHMTITNSGNVGIGTASPNINGANNVPVLTIQGSTGRGILELATGAGDADNINLGELLFAIPTNPPTDTSQYRGVAMISARSAGGTANNRGGSLLFLTRTGGGVTEVAERMRIDNAGNVGIGMTNPSSKLHVSGDYIQIPTTTALPPSADCDTGSEMGRMIVVYDQASTQHLAICSKTSAGPIQWQYK